MDIRVLQYFLAVAREESITGAAEALHMTQPPLSKQLSELERELGKQLFLRGSRKITLTEEGMILRKRAEEIVELLEKTKSEISSSEELSGTVHIGGGETEAMRLIARVVRRLRRDCPQIRYHLFSGNADDVSERLDRGLIDFGVVLGSASLRNYDHMQLAATDTWGLIMRRDSPLAALDFIKPEHLYELPLICSRQSLLQNELSSWLGMDFDKLDVVASYNLIFNAALLVEEGVGYALCIDRLLRDDENSPLCFRPLEPTITTSLYIVWKKYQVFSKPAQRFLDELRKVNV